MTNYLNKNLWLSRIGLGLIFCYCFLVSIFFSYFAQIHISLSFLPFPIFVGEILIFMCIPLLVGVGKGDQLLSARVRFLLVLYFSWVGFRALINYYYDGPLTARNAALFYYPIFAVFTYYFYRRANIPRVVLLSLAVLAVGIMFFKIMFVWYWWTYVTVFAIAVWNMKSLKWRWFGGIFLVFMFLWSKEYFYQGMRAHFVSIFFVIVFLSLYFGALLIKRRSYISIGILFLGFLIFISGYFIFSEHNAVSSVTSLKGIIRTYNQWDKLYQERQENYVPEKLSVHLYNPKRFKTIFLPSPSEKVEGSPATPTYVASPSQGTSSNTAISRPSSTAAVRTADFQDIVKDHPTSSIKKTIKNAVAYSHLRQDRPLDLDENNIVFRLFVWRDMARELIEQRAWWGFSFGYPQRSKSLEVLHWAEGEWSRDGWITPHNSFFHIIYRAGLLGVFLIGVIFFILGRLIRDFFMMNSVVGGFLVGAVVYWVVLANFFVILEFPYNAIVFWSLFGIILAYRDGLKEKLCQHHL